MPQADLLIIKKSLHLTALCCTTWIPRPLTFHYYSNLCTPIALVLLRQRCQPRLFRSTSPSFRQRKLQFLSALYYEFFLLHFNLHRDFSCCQCFTFTSPDSFYYRLIKVSICFLATLSLACSGPGRTSRAEVMFMSQISLLEELDSYTL